MGRINYAFGITVLLLHIMLLTSCSKPYIGQRVNYNNPYVCSIGSTNQHTIKYKHFLITYTVTAGKVIDSYILDGNAKWIGSGIFRQIERAHFTLLLIRDSEIIDTVSFMPMNTDLSDVLKFKRSFTCPGGFDAVTILYSIIVSDSNDMAF